MSAKSPTPQTYTLKPYEPPKPTLWQQHRRKVGLAGAVLGLVLVAPHVTVTHADQAQVGPGHSTSTDVRSCTQTP
jgi:hypothetical protein